MEKSSLILSECRIGMTEKSFCIHAPDAKTAKSLLDSFRNLAAQALRLGKVETLVYFPKCRKPFQIPASMADSDRLLITASQSGGSPGEPKQPDLSQINSYTPSRVSPDAGYEEITDFIKGWRAQGLIVTVTSMVSDKCLMVNDLQVLDRNDSNNKWTIEDWTGLDFKTLWRDSFLRGRKNYYGDLVDRIGEEFYLSGFEYQIRRPSGALAEYTSDYHFVRDFAGIPVRVAISKPGAWRIVQAAPNGSVD